MSVAMGEIEGKSAFAQVENAGLDGKGSVGDYRSEAIAAENVSCNHPEKSSGSLTSCAG